MTISELIAFLQEEGMPNGREPAGCPAEQLDELKLPGGEPLPDALREWVAFSAQDPKLFKDAESGDFEWALTDAEGFFDEEQDFLMDAMGDDYDGDLSWVVNRISRDLRSAPWIRLKDALTGEPTFLVMSEKLPIINYARASFIPTGQKFESYIIANYGDDDESE